MPYITWQIIHKCTLLRYFEWNEFHVKLGLKYLIKITSNVCVSMTSLRDVIDVLQRVRAVLI